jgi:hypothetical protein
MRGAVAEYGRQYQVGGGQWIAYSHWPELSEAGDGSTIATLHLFSQIAGNVAVAVLPWRNHGWHATLHLHPRGLRTEPLHGAGGPSSSASISYAQWPALHGVPITDDLWREPVERIIFCFVRESHGVSKPWKSSTRKSLET